MARSPNAIENEGIVMESNGKNLPNSLKLLYFLSSAAITVSVSQAV